MKYHQMIRLFISSSLQGDNIILSELADVHYLINVMRKKKGDRFLAFNKEDGEYEVEIVEISKKLIKLESIKLIRCYEPEIEVNLIFAPIKQARMSFMIEKATELGVNKLIPIETKYSVVDKINLNKWNIYLKEASEQSRRISLPEIENLQSLNKFIDAWPSNKDIILCNEIEQSLSLNKHLQSLNQITEINLMIGPEGGFSEQELLILNSKPFINSVHLGSRILRAETAALAALSISQGIIEENK